MNKRKKRHIQTGSSLPVISPEEAFKIPESLTPEEEAENAKRKKIDANDLVHNLGAAGFRQWLNTEAQPVCVHRTASRKVNLKRLSRLYPELRRPVIHGLLRSGEIMNVIAAPKIGKSVLTNNLCLNVISAGKFFGQFQCERGRMLICDNELHPETIVNRNQVAAAALNIPFERASKLIDYIPLRGELMDIVALDQEFKQIRSGEYIIVVLDAFYKMFPAKVDENSNAEMSAIYSLIDKYADALQSAFVLIHHTSKGVQGDRATTDVGAGAGAQSRAADTHLIIRPHEDPGVAVIDAVARSFEPIEPFCARFKYPVWELAPNSDPEMVKGGLKSKIEATGRAGAAKAEAKASQNVKVETFLKTLVTPITVEGIFNAGVAYGLTDWKLSHAERLTKRMTRVSGRIGTKAPTFQYGSTQVETSTSLESNDAPDA